MFSTPQKLLTSETMLCSYVRLYLTKKTNGSHLNLIFYQKGSKINQVRNFFVEEQTDNRSNL